MTEDEEIKNSKFLFKCYHVDDRNVYKNLISKKIPVTFENIQTSDFQLALIENTESLYGFSAVCKRGDKWEYDGFGHTGAASIVAALLKEITCLQNELKQLKQKK